MDELLITDTTADDRMIMSRSGAKKRLLATLPARITTPVVIVSLALLLVSGVAAAILFQLQRNSAELADSSLSQVNAARELESLLGEQHRALGYFLATGDDAHLRSALGIHPRADRSLVRYQTLLITSTDRTLVTTIREEYAVLRADLDSLGPHSSPDQILTLIQRDEELLRAAGERREQHAKQMAAALERTQQTAAHAGIALLVFGVCGACAGLAAGIWLDRRLRSSIVELQVPVRDAAGRLNEVVGPVTLAGDESLASLEQSLQTVANRVGSVVDRLQQSEHESLRAEQLAAVGQLASGLAHELRNPLTAMKTLIQAAREGGDSATLGGRDLEILEEETTRLNDGIQTFLDFARPPRIERKRIDLADVVDRTIQLVRRRAELNHVTIDSHVRTDSTGLDADPAQISQVLVNLLFNACDAMPRGGRIDVTLRGSGDPAVLQLDVADTGSGIPHDLRDRLFEPFVSSKETGTGLGLPICRRIVRDHGGTLRAANRTDQSGAIFSIRLPVRTGSATEAHPTHAETA